MGTRVATLALSLVMALCPLARADSEKEIRMRDLVRVSEGKLLYDDLAVCHFEFPDGETTPKFQIHSQAEAPSTGVISRDNFVALITQQEMVFALAMMQGRPGLTPPQALQALQCSPLGAPIGTPDVELRITLTAEGMQVETTQTATGRKGRFIHTWE